MWRGAAIVCLLLGSSGLAHAQGRYYTEAQAERGKALFERHCASCHAGEPFPGGQRPPDTAGRGFLTGGSRVYQSLGAPYLKTTFSGRPIFPSVYFFYRRMEGQPATDVASISMQQRTDIAAYLLRTNGLPAGSRELPPNLDAMRGMFLNEDGFEPLFNGYDFTGLKFLLGPNCRPAPAGCGKTEPGDVFWIKNGVLGTTGRIHGYWYPEKPYRDFTLRFDYRFDVSWPDDEDLFIGNSGALLFITEHQVWPQGIEIDGSHRTNLKAIPLGGTKAKVTEDVDARKRARRPIGSWQSVEIVSKGGRIRASLNGTLITEVLEHDRPGPGFIGIQVQGTPLQWRNIRIKVEAPE
jgi:mono/diheme cytochrome c family protein